MVGCVVGREVAVVDDRSCFKVKPSGLTLGGRAFQGPDQVPDQVLLPDSLPSCYSCGESGSKRECVSPEDDVRLAGAQ